MTLSVIKALGAIGSPDASAIDRLMRLLWRKAPALRKFDDKGVYAAQKAVVDALVALGEPAADRLVEVLNRRDFSWDLDDFRQDVELRRPWLWRSWSASELERPRSSSR